MNINPNYEYIPITFFIYEDVVDRVDEYPLLTKEHLETFETKMLMAQKPNGLKYYLDREHFVIKTYGFKKHPFWCAVNVKDFRDVLNSRPHVKRKKDRKK